MTKIINTKDVCKNCIHGKNGKYGSPKQLCCKIKEFDPKWCLWDKMRANAIKYIKNMRIWCRCGKMYVHDYEGEASCPDVDYAADDGNYGGHDFLCGSGMDVAIAQFLMKQFNIKIKELKCDA